MRDNSCAILMFHHVAEPDRSRIRCNDHLKVSPGYFEKLIREFKGKGYAFISMDEVADNLKRGRKFRKNLALTFDDGYEDNFSTAYPIMAAANVPGTVYVATGLAVGESPIWWDAIEDFLLANETVVLPSGDRMATSSLEEKGAAFLRLRDWVFSLPPDRLEAEVAEFCLVSPSDLAVYRGQMAGADRLREFADNPLLSLGCHTHRHIPCGRLADAEVEVDIRDSVAVLKSCGINPRHFAFPYGDDEHDARRFRHIFESLGFISNVTTFNGLVSVGASDPYFLKRIFVSEYDAFSESVVAAARRKRIGRCLRHFQCRRL